MLKSGVNYKETVNKETEWIKKLRTSKSVGRSVAEKNVIVSSQNSVNNNIEASIVDGDDDDLLMKACDEYEKSVSNINLGGILQGPTFKMSTSINKTIKTYIVIKIINIYVQITWFFHACATKNLLILLIPQVLSAETMNKS